MLEIPASSLVLGIGFLKHVLSTITSPAFSDLVVVYRDYDFYGVSLLVEGRSQLGSRNPKVQRESERLDALQRRKEFEAIREMHKVRCFRLILRADVWGRVRVMDYVLRDLKKVVAAERADRGLDDFSFEPLVVSNPQESYKP